MNIIIPLGGKGERFSKYGYTNPKPMIPIFEKTMIEYVLDHLTISKEDKIFIIYHFTLDEYGFSELIMKKYPSIHLIILNQDTKGAVETLLIGIESLFTNGIDHHKKCLILDCDTFYTEDIINIFKSSNDNMVFYTKNNDPNPIYSYIEMKDSMIITNIKEKEKISDNANTGAYGFTDIYVLYDYCKLILNNNITFKNEPYTSCVISEMIGKGIVFKGYEIKETSMFSLGIPSAVEKYINNTYAFLFDLDGTIVITDEIYYEVWHEILQTYYIELSREIFSNYIQGNNDKYVLNNLLLNTSLSVTELSHWKDELFIKNIHKLKVIEGVYDVIKQIKLSGHKICIVTNCNKKVAEQIIKYIDMECSIDFIISNDDCIYGKPNPEPYKKAMEKYKISNHKCFIFEDSKTGILSGKGIRPKLLIGMETIYNESELLKYGANLSIKNFVNFEITNLIHHQENIAMYLKNIIEKNSIIPNIQEIHIDEEKLKGGFIADVISFKITTTNHEKIYSNILKYENPQENNLSIMAKKIDLYEREYYFYTNISKHINICIPIFHNLVMDDEFNNKGIVLENLIDKKYEINLNLNKESIDVSLKIIDRMAKMHSKFWNQNLEKMFPKLKKSNDIIFKPFFSEFIHTNYETFKLKWFKILNPTQIQICNHICNQFSMIQDRFSEGNHLTFIHGDIKSPNIFYDVVNNHEPYFIDWQHCAIGKGVQDLIFFIIESFDIIHIHSIFHLSKHYYYKKLLEYGITNYSLQEYENDIYDAICYIPFFTSIWFGTIPQDELIDKNFPYFLINKMFYLLELLEKK